MDDFDISIIKRETKIEIQDPRLLDKLPEVVEFETLEEPKTSIKGSEAEFKYQTEIVNQKLINDALGPITKFISRNGNFTDYKAALWRKEFKIEDAVAYNLALLIPDIYRNPLSYLKITENPHLGLYLYGLPGDGRDTIAKCLSKQWLYSVRLSMAGLDSDVGVCHLLSSIDVNTLLLATDIGTATKKLKKWQTNIPQVLTNFTWDGYDIRHTKSEGSLECKNRGVSAFMGGNVPLGSEPFAVRDVSRILQREIPPMKARRTKMTYDAILRRVDLSNLTDKKLLAYHVLCALIMKGKIKNWPFAGKKVNCVVTEGISKRIGAFILRNYIPQLEDYNDEEIFNKEEEIIRKLETDGTEEDTNAISRILAFAHMFVMNSCVDNLLDRGYLEKKDCIEIYPNESDLTVMKIILDETFWKHRRQELIEQKRFRLKKEKPSHLVPHRYFHNLLKEKSMEAFSAKELYNMSLKRLVVDEKILRDKQFYTAYGNGDEIANNHILRNAVSKLAKQRYVKTIGEKPIKYFHSSKPTNDSSS